MNEVLSLIIMTDNDLGTQKKGSKKNSIQSREACQQGLFGLTGVRVCPHDLFDRGSLTKKDPVELVQQDLDSEPAGIQTPSLLIRSQMLYSVKLQARLMSEILDCKCKE